MIVDIKEISYKRYEVTEEEYKELIKIHGEDNVVIVEK
jgi:hypothetical protein